MLIQLNICHINNIVINDYKLPNLVIDERFNPKIIDLGDILHLTNESDENVQIIDSNCE